MGRVDFPTTMWATISSARRRGTRALNDLVGQYREPVYEYLRQRGFFDSDAEDLTQDVFSRLIVDDVLQKANRQGGHFRSFVLGVTKNMIREREKRRHAVKRGGGRADVSLDAFGDETKDGLSLDAALAGEEKDDEFDRAWVNSLLTRALAELRRESEARGTPHYDLLREHHDGGASYQALADRYGKSAAWVRGAVHSARLRLSMHIKRDIRRYSSSAREYDAEIRYLSKLLPRGHLPPE